jgi:hypothetical protein
MSSIILWDCDLCGVRFQDRKEYNLESRRRNRDTHKLLTVIIVVESGEGRARRTSDLCQDCRIAVAKTAEEIMQLRYDTAQKAKEQALLTNE